MQTWSAPASRWACTRARIACLVAPDDDRVTQPLAAAVVEVGLLEPEPEHVVPVVRRRHVEGDVLAGELARPLGVVGEDHRLLGREQLSRAEPFPGLCGVLDRDEVRVRAVGAVAGEVEHLRPERGEHDRAHGRAVRGRCTAPPPSRPGMRAWP